MKKRNYLLTLAAVALLTLSTLTGCGGNNTATVNPSSEDIVVSEVAEGGVLCLKVNPEIAISYDNEGLVTKVEARNDDGNVILESYSGYEGKECREVVKELVTAIGEAGYFVEEVEGESRQITIEIEVGSKIPHDTFIDDVVADVKTCVSANDWSSPIALEGNTDYGITDYVDTDYGPNNDGVTDYDDTDYGPNNDGVTDYDDTDYGPNNDGVTDYDDTDYGPNNDGVTDYDDTDYGPNNDGVTDYDTSDYGTTEPAPAPTPEPAPAPKPAPTPDNGDSNYDDGNSNYDDGRSNYDDGGSNYDDGDSNYDD